VADIKKIGVNRIKAAGYFSEKHLFPCRFKKILKGKSQ